VLSRSSRPGRELRIVIAGGGASGTLLAIQLLLEAGSSGLPARIWLIDQYGRHGLGQAYSADRGEYLLNSAAGAMSALPGHPDHLVSWAAEAADTGGAGQVSEATFLPRRTYGSYLRDTLAAAERAARPTARLTRITATVTAIRAEPGGGRAARLQTTCGPLDADVAVLATGHEPGALPFGAPDSGAVISDPWLPGALDQLCGGSGRCRVVVVGTGLTMADVAMAVTAARPGSTVHAVSRHGLLPRPHHGPAAAPPWPLWLPALSPAAGPVRLNDLMWQVGHAIAASPGSWQAVLEALRPHVPRLWHGMPDQDKRAFLRHVARYWEVHRHLMPPATAARITMLRQTGRLVVHRGRVMAARQLISGLSVLVDAGPDIAELEADWLINGSGSTAASPLLRDLFASGMARPGPVQLGIDADCSGAVLRADGRPSTFLHALGPPLRGLWYETTAIPEIREQAAALAARIIGSRAASRGAA
jgi:uncharacterized NAD(P)/FAD-binding protein YdhS